MSEVKKFFKNPEERGLRLRISTIVLTIFCTLILIVATFSVIGFHDFFIPTKASNISSQSIVLGIIYKNYWYIPQIPVLFFIATFLGRKFGALTVLLYVILGFVYFPIFALGGGYSYITNHNCGYVLSYLPAVFVMTSYLKNRKGFWSCVKAAFFGVLIIHIIGCMYLAAIGLVKQDSIQYIGGYIYVQSITRFIYDFLYGLIAILIAKPFRKVLLMLLAE